MFLRATRPLLHCALAAWLCVLRLTPSCDGQFQMVAPSGPVLAMLGVDVVLSCQLEPPVDVSLGVVEWARLDLNPRFVYVSRNGVELQIHQNPLFVDRTHVKGSRLKHGDLSLRLSDIDLSDEGTYRCNVPGKGSAEVHLHVGAAPPSVEISEETDRSGGGVALGCRSSGWYPEPRLLWLDGEGKPVSAGPPRTLRGPDGLYSISSRVTVEGPPGNTFSCQVHQSNISQTRTARVSLREEDLQDASGSVVRIVIVIVSSVGVVVLSLFGLWRLKVNVKSEKKTKTEEELVELKGEPESLKLDQKRTSEKLKEKEEELEKLKKEPESLKLDQEGTSEKLKEKEEELSDVIDQVKKWENEMKRFNGGMEKLLEDLREKIKVKEKELDVVKSPVLSNLFYKPSTVKHLLEEEINELQRHLDESTKLFPIKLENIQQVIQRSSDQKNKPEEPEPEPGLPVNTGTNTD